MPSYSAPGLPSANGGIARMNPNRSFQLYNAAQNVPLIGIQEKNWHAAVFDPIQNRLWIGSDTGLRWIQPGTLQTGIIPKENIPVNDILLEGKWLGNWPVFRNRRFQWVKIQNNAVNRFLDDLPIKFKLLDVIVANNSDTLVLLDSLNSTPPVGSLYRKSGAQLNPFPYGDSIAHFTLDKAGRIWTLTHKGVVSRFGENSGYVLDSISASTATCLTSDSTGNIWWILDQHRVYRLSPIQVQFSKYDTVLLCDSTTWQFRDLSSSLNRPISSWLWDFGDGQTSSEKDPRHAFKQEGLYTVRLTVGDGAGATATASKEVLVSGNLYLRVKTPGPFVSCQPVRLEAYGTSGFFWKKPDGRLDSNAVILADQSGLYRVQASSMACMFSDSVQVTLQSEPTELGIDLRLTDGSSLEQETALFLPVSLRASAQPGQSVCSLKWKLDGQLLPDSISEIEFLVANEGTHVLEFEGFNALGCPIKARKEWTMSSPFLPNLVSANGDGKNDRFEIPALRLLSGSTLSIYNRWGKQVFTASPYTNNWPETEIAAGTYFYNLQVAGKTFSGWIEVVKP